MSGDFRRWGGWSHVWEHVREVPSELKARAVRMFEEIRPEHATDWEAMHSGGQVHRGAGSRREGALDWGV